MVPDLRARRWLWHERTAWLLLLYASAFGVGLMASLQRQETLLSGALNIALVCAAIMACVSDSVLAGKPMPYSWRFAMVLLAPLLPITAALALWRSRRWWGLLWVVINLGVVLVTMALGVVTVWFQ
jgi:hypothetical protein